MEKKLYRSRRSRVFGGVAGGLGTYFGLDPILVRVIFVLVTIMHGLGVLAYIILWIVIPEEPFEMAYPMDKGEPKPEEVKFNDSGIAVEKKTSTGSIIFGVILIGIGLLFLADKIIPSFCFTDFFPLAIIAIGGFLIWTSLKSRGEK
jgi:phage shock protein PspC (stress-responsive transcriptional regulator)